MKVDGLTLLEGSSITNAVVAHGPSFPTGPTNPPDVGEFFFKTDNADTLGVRGLYHYDGTTWQQLATAQDVADVSNAQTVIGYGDAFPTDVLLNGQIFFLTAPVDTTPLGLYYYDDVATTWFSLDPAYVDWNIIDGTPTTIAGYGITNAYTKTEVDDAIANATPTLDPDLTAIAALSGTTGFLKKTAANTWVLDTASYLTAHPAVSGATSADNSGLAYIQDLTFDSNGHVTGIVSTSIQSATTSQSGVVQLSDSTSTTSSSVAATSTAVKSAYDVASAALPKAGGSMTGSIVIPTGQHITVTDAPSNGTDVVNKNYVDSNISGLSWKDSVKAATTANITLSGTQTVDGVALVAGNRILVKDQSTASQNGIYVVAAGAWTRSTDMDATTPINELNSAAVFAEQGTINADSGWTQINPVSTLGTDAVAFTQFNGAAGVTAGVGLLKTGNVLDVNLGAGVAQLPTDEVGIDVHSTGGLFTTVDGTTSSTVTGAQLAVKTSEGLTTSASGLSIAQKLYDSSNTLTSSGVNSFKSTTNIQGSEAGGKLSLDLTDTGVTAGTYTSVTVDAKGRVTTATLPTTLSGYGITDAMYASSSSPNDTLHLSYGTISSGTWTTTDNAADQIVSTLLPNQTSYRGSVKYQFFITHTSSSYSGITFSETAEMLLLYDMNNATGDAPFIQVVKYAVMNANLQYINANNGSYDQITELVWLGARFNSGNIELIASLPYGVLPGNGNLTITFIRTVI